MENRNTPQQNDDELYSRYLSGDAKAGDLLMLRYADPLAAYLRSYLKSPEDAEDLMLDCFAVILVDRPRIREGCFRAYLFRIARHKACSLWKRKLQRSEFCLSEEMAEKAHEQSGTMDSGETDPEEEVLAGERDAVLRKCLSRITPQYREALWLVYGLQFSYEQAAEVMNCGRKRINNLLVKGKKALRSELEKEGITYADI